MSVKMLYADEHFPMPVVNQLRAKGHDITTVRDDCESKGGDGIEDPMVLQTAAQHKRAVLTMNRRDFEALHKESNGHYGIVIVAFPTVKRKQDKFTVMAKAIDELLRATDSLQGQIFYV